jgi:mRNA interferase HigB
MRIIARSNLEAYAKAHPDARAALTHWWAVAKAAEWKSLEEVKATFSKAKACGPDRIRFDLSGGDYRLIVAFDFRRSAAFIKFVGTQAEYDKVDAATVAQF